MSEAYRVGVTFALNNLVSAELARIATQFASTNRQAKELHGTLLKLATIGTLAAGYGAFKIGETSLDEAKKFQTEVARFAAMGFGDKVTQQAVQFAKGMDIMGMSYTDNMQLIREATVVTGSPSTALMVAPELAKFQASITAYMGAEHGEKASRMMLDLYKTAELRGHALDPAQLREELDAALKVYESTGGLVTPQQLFSFIKTGGVAAKGLSAEAFYFQEAHQMQETGGSRAGTSLMSAYQNLAMGRTTQAVIATLMESDLIDKSKVVMNEHTGKPSKLKPGALKDVLEFLNSQFDYFETHIAPQLAGLSKGDAINKIASMSSNRTAMNRMVGFYLEEANIRKAVALGHQATGVDSLYDKEMATYQGQVNDLTSKWRDLMIELGTKVLPTATKALGLLTEIVSDWTDWFKKDDKKPYTGDENDPNSYAYYKKNGYSWNPPPSKSNQPIVVHSYLDTDKVATGIGSIFSDHLGGSIPSPSSFDPRQTPAMPGHSSATGNW